MGFRYMCRNSCLKIALNKTELCNYWRPPPIPKHLWKELENLVLEDTGFKLYTNVCNVESPKRSPSSTTTSTAVSTSRSIINATSGEKRTHTAGGTIALVVILSILLIVVVACFLWWYLWKRNKMRSQSINSLPLKRYEDTNFLDNKVRQNQCYNGSDDLHPDDNHSSSAIQNTGNQYGSFPPSDGKVMSVKYVNGKNRNSLEVKVESQVEFHKMNTSEHSGLSERNAFDNENYMNDSNETGTGSPGANSQTPLFGDMVDGPALPNSVPSIHSSGEPQQNGSLVEKSVGSLPPIDMTLNKSKLRHNSNSFHKSSDSTRKKSDPSLRSPKKKKVVYLQRKSEPVKGLDDIKKDMAGDRKSF